MKRNRLTDEAFWESFYAARTAKHRESQGIVNRQLRKLLSELLPLSGTRLIEFGCGDSQWLPFFGSRFDCRVSGIDYSKRGLELLRGRLKKHGVVAELHEVDFISALPEELSDRFDIASSFGVIEHFESPAEVLKIFSKVVKRDGIVVTVVPKLTGVQGRIQKLISKEIFCKHRRLNMREFVEEHAKAGLDVFFSCEIGLTTLSFNFGTKRLCSIIYRYYSKMVNQVLNRVIDYRVVNPLGLGSAFLILSTKPK